MVICHALQKCGNENSKLSDQSESKASYLSIPESSKDVKLLHQRRREQHEHINPGIFNHMQYERQNTR